MIISIVSIIFLLILVFLAAYGWSRWEASQFLWLTIALLSWMLVLQYIFLIHSWNKNNDIQKGDDAKIGILLKDFYNSRLKKENDRARI